MTDLVSSMKGAVWYLLRKLRLGGYLLQVHPKSFLNKRGWFRSFAERRAIDLEGNPIAWWCYAANDFVEERLLPSMKVLEFGSGSSTLWLSPKVHSIVSIENNASWVEKLKAEIGQNITLIYLAQPETLTHDHFPTDSRTDFDLLIIDPLANRINCAKAGLPFLKSDGVVIWDNTDGSDWPEINALMANEGFKQISFTGLAAQEVALSRTTIFYRQNNVFRI